MPTAAELQQAAAKKLAESGVAEPRREAASLLAFVIKNDRTFLIAHPEYELTGTETNDYIAAVARRAAHEPFQYITGVQEFYGLEFEVTPDVLIPRPETEMVVESAIEILRPLESIQFCEVGIGSGCISVAVLCNVKNSLAVGLEISPAALAVAARNAERHGVSDRLKLIESDVFSALDNEKFDLVASNPPYVPSDELKGLQAEVRDFEPRKALTDEGGGLSIIEGIVADAPRFLRPRGYLLIEIGFSQSPSVKKMFNARVWRCVEFLPDLQGIPRLVRAQVR